MSLFPDVSSSVYKHALDNLWSAHQQQRATNAPTVVSTFAGCGGSSLGYSAAGFDERLAVEWDNHAVEVFRANFPHVPVWHEDIAKLSVEQALELSKLNPGELNVLDGSPPCQGFSPQGKRHLHDSRNQLFIEFVRLVDGLKPEAFVMENVKGMVMGKMRAVFNEAKRALEDCGYEIAAGIINMALLGVPQKRERLVVVGFREDLSTKPSLPRPVPERRTVNDAFKLLSNKGRPHTNLSPNTAKSALLRALQPGQGGADFLESKGRKRGSYSLYKLDGSKPSFTICKTNTPWAHPLVDRLCTDTELCRLASFPDQYNWCDSNTNQIVARIGNSVPPLGMFQIAKHLRQALAQTHAN